MADTRVTRDYDQEEAGFESSGDRVRIKSEFRHNYLPRIILEVWVTFVALNSLNAHFFCRTKITTITMENQGT